MQDFRNLDAWKKAHALVLAIHRHVLTLPKDEAFGVTLTLRRSATAIATRIAEGAGRSTNLDFNTDLRKAASSCNELEYLIVLAHDLSYWKSDLAESLTKDTVEVRKMIFGLLRSL